MMNSMDVAHYQHWHARSDEEGIVWLSMDVRDQAVNTFSESSLNELGGFLSQLALDEACTGLIIRSAKKTGFILGADIHHFKQIGNPILVERFIALGRDVFDRLAHFPKPTLALIEGYCLGGGLELALACRYRIALDDPKTQLGLPEVMLGIYPGWGGLLRLPSKIGALKALPLLLQGQWIRAKQAYALGIVDELLPHRQLMSAARYYIQKKPSGYRTRWYEKLTNMQPFRKLISAFVFKTLQAKVNADHYPAPYAILKHWERYGATRSGFMKEWDSFAPVLAHATVKHLIRLFFLQEGLKAQGKLGTRVFKHVHVIGAGTMGGDIAAWCALKGLRVTLQDQTPEALTKAIGRANGLFVKKLKIPSAVQNAMDRLVPDIEGDGLSRADLIIEAIFENLEVKRELFKTIEKTARQDAILATNTSSIVLDDINVVLKNPERLLGIHFFNPVAKMQLVEVVSSPKTDPRLALEAAGFVVQIAKLALPVKSSPGFLVNRVLSAYLHEAFVLLSEGVSVDEIDSAMKTFGMPMGPLEMADIVGLDICLSVARNIAQYSQIAIPELLENKVKAGTLGKKTQHGFYEYRGGQKRSPSKSDQPPSVHLDREVITNRLVIRMLNTVVLCFNEKIVESQDLIDAGLIFGAGFAPFRGGPMNYIEEMGIDQIREKVKALHAQYGDRFVLI
jgi:3-hydroxyacyl-CoA dehydrogenase/enoyl-CoA hydratase/3-hydroxybutyryl-CoA epimerase